MRRSAGSKPPFDVIAQGPEGGLTIQAKSSAIERKSHTTDLDDIQGSDVPNTNPNELLRKLRIPQIEKITMMELKTLHHSCNVTDQRADDPLGRLQQPTEH